MLDLWLIPLWPLLGFLVNGFFGRRLGKPVVAKIACGSVGLSLLASIRAVWDLLDLPPGARRIEQVVAPWIGVGSFQADWGLLLDPLSAVMILVVTGVGFLIHVYSVGYMHDDRDFPRFFTYLNLFIFSMLMLVLASNFLLLYVFWEAVGLCSYLLIGFWFERQSAAEAGKKAFIVNRVGDFGFGLGVMLLWTTLGTLEYAAGLRGGARTSWRRAAGWSRRSRCCCSWGPRGKSAQLPLYVWLPDAMEGPTPVSALIHAATMVTAGVYMVARSAPLFDLAPLLDGGGGLGRRPHGRLRRHASPWSRPTSSGCWPTPPSASSATCSWACGVGAYAAGIFHLVTHAFFKALLFLGAGVGDPRPSAASRTSGRWAGSRGSMPITSLDLLSSPPWPTRASPARRASCPRTRSWRRRFAGHHYLALGCWAPAAPFMTAFYMFRLVLPRVRRDSPVDRQVRPPRPRVARR